MNLRKRVQTLLQTGVTKELPFEEKRKIMAVNFGVCLGLAFKSFFALMNFCLGFYSLALVNVLMLAGNATILLLQHKGYYKSVRYMLVLGMMILFTYLPINYHNSSEYILILNIAGILLLFDNQIVCFILMLLNATCFVFVKWSLGHIHPMMELPPYRNMLNLAGFFICLGLLLLYYRKQQKIYQHKLEKMNDYLNDKSKSLEDLNRSKEKIFSILSHDLRQPLASVKSLIQLMNRQALSQEAFKDLSANVNASLDNIILSMDNTLNWSVNQFNGIRTRPEAVDLYEIAGQVYELLQDHITRKNIVFIDNIQVLARVYADKEQVTIILRNLLSNAIKFTNNGGLIHLSAREKGNSWELNVEDNGIGMDHETIRKIFDTKEHFTRRGTANEKGTGLGLTLVRELVQMNDGEISVTSLPGKGTTFSIHLKKAAHELVAVASIAGM